MYVIFFFFSSRRRHTRWTGDWSSDVCSSDLLVDVQDLHFFLDDLEEILGVEFGQAPVLADGVDGSFEEISVADAGNLNRILKRQEDAFARPVLGVHVEQVFAVETDV